MPTLTIACAYCDPPKVLGEFEPKPGQSELAWRQNWKNINYRAICPSCTCEVVTEDDGIPADEGGFVTIKDITKPDIMAISNASGPRAGGASVMIYGRGYLGAPPTVKFANKACPHVWDRGVTGCMVETPPATYTLNLEGAGPLYELTLTDRVGDFQVGESFTVGGSGLTGVVRKVAGNTIYVAYATEAGTVGESATGGISGATATIYGLSQMSFVAGEQVTGQTTGAIGVLVSLDPYKVELPSQGFAAGELVKGDASSALMCLDPTTAYSGTVDITVENEFGQRPTGYKLEGAYTYA
jgi:hypothetical protein